MSNVISVQAEVIFNNQSIFLCGDASFECVKDKLSKNYTYIQASHHGKLEFAKNVYELKKEMKQDFCFIISDNTGNTNAGSDELEKELKQCRRKSTKNGRIILDLKLVNLKRTWGL